MSMQLFSFGHPCEHQLRRACIGGSSCPLNGYPDTWCCSFIKGKINFKRDKPCEGPRCRWGFTHPTQAQFDAVTQVLNESRPIANDIDEADPMDILQFNIESQHVVDTVQCALHMMRHPPSSCGRRVGQLLAYATVKAGDAKVFTQLLKTMKKPIDNYLLGAHAYLTEGALPTQTKSSKKGAKKDDATEDLKNDLVDLMNAALSQGGQLVDRDDQHVLQTVFVQVLRAYPRGNKKRQEMLENALAKFGHVSLTKPDNTPALPSASSAAFEVAGGAQKTNTAAAAGGNSTEAGTSGHPGTAKAATTTAGGAHGESSSACATKLAVPSSHSSTRADANAASAAAPKVVESTLSDDTTDRRRAAAAAAVVAAKREATTASTASAPPTAPTSTSPALAPSSTVAATPMLPPAMPEPAPISSGPQALSPAAGSRVTVPKVAPATLALTPQQQFVGVTRVVNGRVALQPSMTYEPIRTDLPVPDIALFGGLFGLTVSSAAILGMASTSQPFIDVSAALERADEFDLVPGTGAYTFFSALDADTTSPDEHLLEGVLNVWGN